MVQWATNDPANKRREDEGEMKARVRIAVIRDDHTWYEDFIEAGGSNWTNTFQNVKSRTQEKLRGGDLSKPFPPGVIGFACLEGTQIEDDEQIKEEDYEDT